MIRMNRPKDAPVYLAENATRWTAEYGAKKRADRTHRFRWPITVGPGAKGAPLNRHLMKDLLSVTLGHCSYCDGFPMGETSRETIDHFRPKGDARFLDFAFEWTNLFPACDVCQAEKQDAFDDGLLKPDEPTYTFARYFDFNARTGELEPNRLASEVDQQRTQSTIRMFGLNIEARCASRLRFFQWHYRAASLRAAGEVDVLPYRYLAPAAL